MPRISTRNLGDLPRVECFKARLQSLAVLDAIMSPDSYYRYYSFNSKWSPNEEMGSMSNGSGDEFFALFNQAGCFIKGFAHEYDMTPYRIAPPAIWPGMFDGLPSDFSAAATEPAFTMEDTTFCIWRRYCDPSWCRGTIDFPEGDDPDGSEFLLEILDGEPATYQRFAEDYFEKTVPAEAVRHVHDHLPLTEDVVKSLNPDASIKNLVQDLNEVGYPNPEAISQ